MSIITIIADKTVNIVAKTYTNMIIHAIRNPFKCSTGTSCQNAFVFVIMIMIYHGKKQIQIFKKKEIEHILL